MRFYFFIFLVLYACFSCNQRQSGSSSEQRNRRRAQVAIVSPRNNEQQPLGAKVNLSVRALSDAEKIDSVRWFVNGIWLTTTQGNDAEWDTGQQTTGSQRIEAAAHYSSGQRDIVSTNVILLAPRSPVQYSFRVINVFPHDPKAFTQGLLFHDGYLYESTGLLGESTLRKVNLHTGKPEKLVELPTEMFGEGLALVDERLIQLTWKNQVAFVYNKNDFTLLNRINYNIREGWGLTFDGTHLLMTDGSANLYFLDKNDLREIKRIEICDDKGPVHRLNELEYIDGKLWANVFLTDDILIIDPLTGAVTGRIDMSNLLHARDKTPETDVLNGIAYDAENKRIFVTGKNWSKLFEIQIRSLVLAGL